MIGMKSRQATAKANKAAYTRTLKSKISRAAADTFWREYLLAPVEYHERKKRRSYAVVNISRECARRRKQAFDAKLRAATKSFQRAWGLILQQYEEPTVLGDFALWRKGSE